MAARALIGRITLGLVVVALVAAAIGLLAPVSIPSGAVGRVPCGSALRPDLTDARARTASPDAVPDPVRRCEKEITDTRQLGRTVLVAAAVALVAGTVSEVRAGRRGEQPAAGHPFESGADQRGHRQG